jgi:hypothetical protein
MDSKYRFAETERGFVVDAPDRDRVAVELMPDGTLFHLDSLNTCGEFGLYQYYQLSASIARGLMNGWKPPEREGRKDFPGLHRWVIKQTAKSIGKRVHAQWKRLLTLANPDAVAVQRAVWAATFCNYGLSLHPGLYRVGNEYLIRDIIKYRAAAIASVEIEKLAHAATQTKIHNSPEAHALRQLADRLGVEIAITPGVRARPLEDAIEVMCDWRALFSPTGQDYRSLNRTLMNLPGGIPAGMLANLVYVELERPLTDRTELLMTLAAAERTFEQALHIQAHQPHWHILHHARRVQIVEAMERVGRFTHNQLKPRRTRDIVFLAHYLSDCPDQHNGNIVGLADRAIEWHRAQRDMETKEMLKRLGDTRTALPPIPLPDHPAIRFLDTPRAIADEGKVMEHCIASYADQAVSGHCYLFHVELDGESASVEVDYTGRVVQSQGPFNKRNGAARWGSRMLRRWGSGFPAHVRPPAELALA